jgi:hypothetical protein
VSPERAFLLYLCWEQANLHGTEVTLSQLADDGAVVRLKPIYLMLYERTGHLRQQITLDDYRRLFEFRWHNRAASAGWELTISYDGEECLFRFTRRRP